MLKPLEKGEMASKRGQMGDVSDDASLDDGQRGVKALDKWYPSSQRIIVTVPLTISMTMQSSSPRTVNRSALHITFPWTSNKCLQGGFGSLAVSAFPGAGLAETALKVLGNEAS